MAKRKRKATKRQQIYRRRRRLVIFLLLVFIALLILLICFLVSFVSTPREENSSSEPLSSETIIIPLDEEESSTPEEPLPPEEIPYLPSNISDGWALILVNRSHPLPEEYAVTQESISTGISVDYRIADPLKEMVIRAKEDGINLVLTSGYQDGQLQQQLFDDALRALVESGMSEELATAEVQKTTPLPEYTDARTGLSVSITTSDYLDFSEGFADSSGGLWLADHAYEYGFVLRYPQGKESVTGMDYNPFYFRYVGKDAAYIMRKNDLCLEEYIEQLVQGVEEGDSSSQEEEMDVEITEE